MASGAYNRKKGHDLERAVARLLKRIDPTARRNVEECQQASVDIKMALPFDIQCKRIGRWSMTPHAILQEAVDGGTPGNTPVGIVKTNRQEAVVVMYAEDWFRLVATLYAPAQNHLDPCSQQTTAPAHDNEIRIQMNAKGHWRIDLGEGKRSSSTSE